MKVIEVNLKKDYKNSIKYKINHSRKKNKTGKITIQFIKYVKPTTKSENSHKRIIFNHPIQPKVLQNDCNYLWMSDFLKDCYIKLTDSYLKFLWFTHPTMQLRSAELKGGKKGISQGRIYQNISGNFKEPKYKYKKTWCL